MYVSERDVQRTDALLSDYERWEVSRRRQLKLESRVLATHELGRENSKNCSGARYLAVFDGGHNTMGIEAMAAISTEDQQASRTKALQV